MGCLNALGADITRTESGYRVVPVKEIPKQAALLCHDSGSTLRFLLPVAGALGIDATFHLEGRLPSRPLSPLWEEMERMGCTLTADRGYRPLHRTTAGGRIRHRRRRFQPVYYGAAAFRRPDSGKKAASV